MTPSSNGPTGSATTTRIPGPADREAFFAQQARYRRQTWRLAALCAVAIVLMGIPLSVVISPFVWALAILAADLVNLVQPFPNLFRLAIAGLQRGLGSSRPPSTADLVWLGAALVLPGIAFMGAAWTIVRGLLERSGTSGIVLALGARDPRPDVFEEKRLVDIVEEIAIAAGVAPPRVQLLEDDGANAGVFGSGREDAVIVVSRGLLGALDREETEGVIAHLVASIGNGDLRASLAILSVLETLGLVSVLLAAPLGRQARSVFVQIVKLAVRRGHAEDAERVRELLLASAADMKDEETPRADGKTRLRDVLKLPFMIGQAAFMINQWVYLWLLAGPLIALRWRARRYLADATAVELTRNPNGLARGLVQLASGDDAVASPAWSSHLFIVGQTAENEGRRFARLPDARPFRATRSSGGRSTDNALASFVSFDPPLHRRLAHLKAAGATADLPPPPERMSPKARLILTAFAAPLFLMVFVALFVAAVGLVYVALAIYMLFLLPMVAALHVVLHRFL